MTRVKISFLFILGVCFVIIAISRGLDSNRGILTAQKQQFLAWNGSQIVVIKSKSQAEKYNAENTIPQELCPIFFHPISLNSADKELLVTLPGIGPVTAELIVRKRLELGKIISSEQLMSIKGIGEKTAKVLEQYTTFEL